MARARTVHPPVAYGADASLGFASLAILLCGIALAVGPHLPRLPWWVSTLAVALLAWRAWAAWHGDPMPRRWFLVPLVLFGVAGVYLTHKTLFGRDAGVTLLVLFLALKLMEIRSYRDVMVTTFLCYFLALTNFLYSQTIPTALLMVATVLVVSTALVGFNGPRRSVFANAKTAGALLVQGVPLMVILFFLFPRVDGPLWGLPADAFGGTTGLSDTMTPGSISSLSQSDAIAFRARFEGTPPEKRLLYWRGPVFWEFDGRTWRAGKVRLSERYEFEGVGDAVDYSLTLEPHDRTWIFPLELASKVPSDVHATGDFQLLAQRPVRMRTRYAMSAFLRYRATGGASEYELKAGRELPPGYNPRAIALAQGWRIQSRSDEEILSRAIEHFKAGGFEYTVRPPLLGLHSVDEFLFETKRGFCEHFASAFTFLMRSAGLPARVVTGYQGGEVNPVDGFVTVRQADAHAWVEVYLGRRGWVRVDPTAAAVPQRIESGLAAAVPAGEPLPLLIRADLSWLRTLRFNWEALANYWNQWVLGYNTERQRDLLTRLGMPSPNWQNLAMALFWGIGLLVAVSSLWILHRQQARDPVQSAWNRFCAKLRRRGAARGAAEGPATFAVRAAARFPQQADAVRRIAALYMDLRYGPTPDPARIAELRRMVRHFRL